MKYRGILWLKSGGDYMSNNNQNDRLMWLNGEILPVKDAMVSILSPTAQFGANVFEGIRCY